jgi:flagellar hook protein FlgE
MSISGALNTAVSGLDAQAAALATISNNVANSQTVGYKQIDTNFVNYLTVSNAAVDGAASVVAKPYYANDFQGAITQSSDATSMGISGQGFFAVQKQTGSVSGQTTYDSQQYYTRAGDFTADSGGKLVNSAGYTLDGYLATTSATGVVTFNRSALVPIAINKAPSPPVATTTMSLAANLPATPPVGATSFSTTQQVYDPLGNPHNITSTWAQVPPLAATPTIPTNQYTLTIAAPGSPAGGTTTTGPLYVTFGTGTVASGGNGAPAGTIKSITSDQAGLLVPVNVSSGTAASPTTATPATVAMALNYGTGAQTITLGLGNYQSTNGVTQFAGTTYQVASQSANGLPQGNYSSVAIDAQGNVSVNYDNGATTTIATIPIATFPSPDTLQSEDGQAYTQSLNSGSANLAIAGTVGAGTLATNSVEGSNVDIAGQFTDMIVAQRAYEANAKMITTAATLLQTVIQMVQ